MRSAKLVIMTGLTIMCLALPASGKTGDMQGTIKKAQAGVGVSGEITGKVLKSDNNNITVEYQGIAVPLRVSRRTMFEGNGINSPSDVMEGQQVRAGFELDIHLAQNRLTSLKVLDGERGPGRTGRRSKRGSEPCPSCPRESGSY